MVRDAVNYFGVHDNGTKCNQIRHVFAKLTAAKAHWKAALLIKCDCTLFERYN